MKSNNFFFMLWKCVEKICDESVFLSVKFYVIIRLLKGGDVCIWIIEVKYYFKKL